MSAISELGRRFEHPGADVPEVESGVGVLLRLSHPAPFARPIKKEIGMKRVLRPVVIVFAAMLIASPGQAVAGMLVPFSATYHEQVTFSPCGATVVCVHARGVGLATHLGAGADVNDAGTVDFATAPCATVQTPFASFIGANGDTITVSLSGTGCPTSVFGLDLLNGTYIVTGGTGRFAGAKGGGSAVGVSQLDTSCFCRATTTLTFTGDVTSPGSLN